MIIKAIKVSGTSMRPFIKDGFVFVDIQHRSINRGDLVLYRYDDVDMIHRVIGFEGDFVIISNDDDIAHHKVSKDNIKGIVKSNFNGFLGYYLHILLRGLRGIKKLFR